MSAGCEQCDGRGVVDKGDAAELDQATVIPPSSSAALQVRMILMMKGFFRAKCCQRDLEMSCI
jgi:hypothetical protein